MLIKLNFGSFHLFTFFRKKVEYFSFLEFFGNFLKKFNAVLKNVEQKWNVKNKNKHISNMKWLFFLSYVFFFVLCILPNLGNNITITTSRSYD